MLLNLTPCMLIGNRQRIANKSLDVSIGGSLLTQVNSVRYLGVIIDNALSWSLCISNVASRVRSCVTSIYYLLWYTATSSTLSSVYCFCTAIT